MPKYKVQVECTAKATYAVEVEAETEDQAIGNAISQWRDLTPPEFNVASVDTFDAEADQLTYECEECGSTISEQQYRTGRGCCPDCNKKLIEEEKLYA